MKKFFTLISIISLFVSCAGIQSYYGKLEKFITVKNYNEASELIKSSKNSYGNKSEFLYYLDLGLTQHLAKNYAQSNETFEQAKKIYDSNYTKSISAGAFSLFANDNIIPYYGHPYEAAYVNVFCALNYILQGLDNEAVVEARQIDNLFKKINADSYAKAFYNDDPFIRYFMGLVYENAGYYNDAVISYKAALKNYNTNSYSQSADYKYNKNIGYNLTVPKDLIFGLYDVYVLTGFSSEAEALKNKFPSLFSNRIVPGKNYGELIIINYNGLSPKKIDNIIELSFYKALPYFNAETVDSPEKEQVEKVNSAIRAGFSNDYIKIAFPEYKRYTNKVDSFVVEDINETIKNSYGSLYESAAVADIGTLMINSLQKENLAIYSKTIARAVGRYVLAKVVADQVRQHENEKTGGWLGVLTQAALNVANSLLEKSDKRSWRSLPDTINMARLSLPAGMHTVNIKYLGYDKSVISVEKISVEIKSNKKTFVVTRS